MNYPDQPLVTICIPVYNGQDYIGLTIKSVLSQSYKNTELLIVNNASTDETEKKIKSFSDLRIRYIKNEKNIGMKGNWNKAVKEARGEFVKLLPADDLLYSDCIEKQVQAFIANLEANISIVCCGRDIIDGNGRVLLKRSFFGFHGVINGQRAIKAIICSGTNRLGEPGAILFRKDEFLKTGDFDDKFPYVIDLNTWIKLLCRGNLYVFPESLCAFRVSKSSESVNTRRNHGRDFSSFIRDQKKQFSFISQLDLLSGEVRSFSLEILRRFFYKLSNLVRYIHG